MVISRIWAMILGISIFSALLTGRGSALSAAVPQGAQAGITLALSLGGSMCLWSGFGALMEKVGTARWLARLLSPLLKRIFPASRQDPELAGALSANICANLLGLGNAATPLGIRAAKRLAIQSPGVANHQLCRLIVLNTASIQLIPATVAAVRAQLGAVSPFDILPAVWITSLCSAGIGLLAAWGFGRLWKD